jgi:hypothetical protein
LHERSQLQAMVGCRNIKDRTLCGAGLPIPQRARPQISPTGPGPLHPGEPFRTEGPEPIRPALEACGQAGGGVGRPASNGRRAAESGDPERKRAAATLRTAEDPRPTDRPRPFGAGLLTPPPARPQVSIRRPAGRVEQRLTISAAHPRTPGPIRGRSKSWRLAGLRPIRVSCGRAGSGRVSGREVVRSGVSRWSLSWRFVKLNSCLIMRIQTALSARSIIFDRVPGGLLSCAGRMP